MASDRSRTHRDEGDDLHTQVFDLLLEKVREDQYPSTTMLDMVEAMLRDDELEQYTSVLIDKINSDNYPSMDQLRRLQALA